MAEKQKTLPGGFEPNADRYREASKPHGSPEAADKAIRAFYDAIGELREKYHVKDLVLVYGIAVVEADGEEHNAMGVSGFGTQTLWEAMAAFAYGTYRKQREVMMRGLLSSSGPDDKLEP